MFESLKGGLLPGSVTQSSLQAQGNTNLETYCLHAPSAEESLPQKEDVLVEETRPSVCPF